MAEREPVETKAADAVLVAIPLVGPGSEGGRWPSTSAGSTLASRQRNFQMHINALGG
ncbi:MAG TPA: hypothetical protein VG146_07560 [Verrucomicrobiae bacterium]|nr:hypothetical protein [Verrucomicrobiae bacterium]